MACGLAACQPAALLAATASRDCVSQLSTVVCTDTHQHGATDTHQHGATDMATHQHGATDTDTDTHQHGATDTATHQHGATDTGLQKSGNGRIAEGQIGERSPLRCFRWREVALRMSALPRSKVPQRSRGRAAGQPVALRRPPIIRNPLSARSFAMVGAINRSGLGSVSRAGGRVAGRSPCRGYGAPTIFNFQNHILAQSK